MANFIERGEMQVNILRREMKVGISRREMKVSISCRNSFIGSADSDGQWR